MFFFKENVEIFSCLLFNPQLDNNINITFYQVPRETANLAASAHSRDSSAVLVCILFT